MNEFSLVSWGFTWHTSGTKSSKSIRQKPLPALPFKRTSFAIYNQHSKLTSGCIEIQPILHIAQKNVEVVLQNCHRWIMKLSKIGMIVFRLLRGFWQAPIICSFPTQLCQRWSGNMGGIYTTKNELALLFSSKKVRDKFYTDKKNRKALIRFVETSGRCRLAARLRIYGLFAGHCIYIYYNIYNHIYCNIWQYFWPGMGLWTMLLSNVLFDLLETLVRGVEVCLKTSKIHVWKHFYWSWQDYLISLQMVQKKMLKTAVLRCLSLPSGCRESSTLHNLLCPTLNTNKERRSHSAKLPQHAQNGSKSKYFKPVSEGKQITFSLDHL